MYIGLYIYFYKNENSIIPSLLFCNESLLTAAITG